MNSPPSRAVGLVALAWFVFCLGCGAELPGLPTPESVKQDARSDAPPDDSTSSDDAAPSDDSTPPDDSFADASSHDPSTDDFSPSADGAPWLVLSNFQIQRSIPDVAFSVDYSFVQGAPDPGQQYVWHVASPLGRTMEKVVEFRVELDPGGGTLQGRARSVGFITGDLETYVAKKLRPGRTMRLEDYEPVSGRLRPGEGESDAQPPEPPPDSGEMFTLSNPQFNGGLGLRKEFSVDYRIAPDRRGSGIFYYWIVKPASGETIEFRVTVTGLDRGGTYSGHVLTRGRESLEGPFEMYIEAQGSGGPRAERRLVSNVVNTD